MSTKEKLLTSAQKFIAKGQLPRAVKDYQQLVKLDPKDIRHRQKLAELCSRAGMTSDALDAFEAVARHYSENGFFLKAIAVYKQMQRLDPGRTSISLKLAELNHKQGLIGNALTEYRVLVSTYEKSGRIQQVAEILQKMKELDPENLNIRVKIIETHLQRAASQEAKAEFAETVEMLEARHDNPRLLKLYEFFLPQFNDDPAMQIGQARIFIAKGESKRAISLLKNLLAEKPQDFTILLQLAEGYRQIKDFAQEIQTYRQLLQGHPDDLKLRVGLVRALLDAGESKVALSKLEEWKKPLLEAGQVKVLKHFYERLKSSLPKEERVIRTLRSITKTTGEKGDLPEVTPASGEASFATPPLESQAPQRNQQVEERPIAQLQEPEGAEEIPLEFLEGFADSASADSEPLELTEVISEPEDETGAIELELDLGFDFDLDTAQADASFANEVPSGGEETIRYSLDEKGSEPLEEDFFDLRSAVLDDPKESVVLEDHSESSAHRSSPRKREIKTDVEVEDPDSHYNLGIAYKEMGLLDEAIGEFDKAASEPSLTVACLTLKGMCLVELGMAAKAEEIFKRALSASELDAEVRKGLLYELGLMYEGCGRSAEAMENYRTVAEMDPSFRHVEEKLRQMAGEGEKGQGRADGRKKDRISYV